MTNRNKEIIDVYNLISKDYYIKRENMALTKEIEKLCSTVPMGGRILDAGCGNGRDTILFAKKGFRVIGVDFSDGQLHYAYQRENTGQISFLKQDILQLDFPTNSFDGIWCCAVLPHFNKIEVLHILQSFNKVLVDSGCAIVTFKKGVGESYVTETEFGNIKRFTSYMNEDEIETIAKMSGFIIKEMYTYNEQERFTKNNRNLDFIVSVLQKSDTSV